jgi:cellulase/cellobiase CelA1
MATLTKAMARGSFATSIADIYIVPSSAATAIITNIVVTNTTNVSQSFNILLDGVELFHNTPISGNSTISIDIKQVLDPSGTPKKVTGFATAATLKYHISGIELT